MYGVATIIQVGGLRVILYRDVAQFGRALGLGPRCRRFESCHLDQAERPLLNYIVGYLTNGALSRLPIRRDGADGSSSGS